MKTMENDIATKSKDLRNRAEQLLREGPKDIKDRPAEDIQKVIHELQVHQIELEMQNEELCQTQLELHAGRDKYSDLYDFAPVGYFTISEKGLIMEANLTGAAMLGVERGRLIGQPFSGFISRDDQETFYFHRRELIETKTRQSCELRLMRKGGSQFYARLECMVVEDDEGNITAFRSAVSDIEERKKAEEELRESEDKYRNLVEESFDGIFIQRGPSIIFANKRLNEMLGYREGELIGQNHWVVYHPDYQKTTRERAEARMRGEEVVRRYEVKLQRKDGSWFYGEINARQITFPSDEESGIQVWIKDIDERKQAEAALRESEKIYRTLFEQSVDAIVLTTWDGTFIDLNRSALELFGYSRAEILGMNFGDLYVDPSNGHRFRKQGEQEGFVKGFEAKLKTKDGAEKDCYFNVTALQADDGSIILYQGVIRDITEEKLMQRRLIQSEKLASLGLLVSGIAHEINNPNNFISFNIPILRDYLNELIPIIDDYADGHHDFELFRMPYSEFREDIFQLLNNMEHGSQRISHTVSSLRDFTRKSDRIRKIWVDLKQVIEKGLSICQGLIKKSVRSFDLDIPEDLPRIFTDPEVLEQALINLVVNAAQAADKEDSRVRLRVTRSDTSQDHLIIEVSDNGCGIDEKAKMKIFDPFFTTKGHGEGSGLGLYVCHELVEGLGGRIEVESEPGKGSTFRVVLPF